MSAENPSNGHERVYGVGPHGQESAIKRTSTFERLYDVLDEIGPVQGSQELFTPEQLKDKIERVRSGDLGLENITSTYGLRERVAWIMQDEKDFPDTESISGAKREGVPEAPEAISQEAQEKAFVEFLKERDEAQEALNPFIDSKLVEAGLVTAEQRDALVKSFDVTTQAGYEKFSSISPERQLDIQSDYEDEKYGRKSAPMAETASVQPSEAVPAPEDAQRLKEVQERLGLAEPSEDEPSTENSSVEQVAHSQEQIREVISPEQFEDLRAQLDDLSEKGTIALYDKDDTLYRELGTKRDAIGHRLDAFFTELPSDTEETKQLLRERAELNRIDKYGKKKREQVGELERRVLASRNA